MQIIQHYPPYTLAFVLHLKRYLQLLDKIIEKFISRNTPHSDFFKMDTFITLHAGNTFFLKDTVRIFENSSRTNNFFQNKIIVFVEQYVQGMFFMAAGAERATQCEVSLIAVCRADNGRYLRIAITLFYKNVI